MQNDDIRGILVVLGTLVLSTILIPDIWFINLSKNWELAFRMFGFCFAEVLLIIVVLEYVENGVEHEK